MKNFKIQHLAPWFFATCILFTVVSMIGMRISVIMATLDRTPTYNHWADLPAMGTAVLLMIGSVLGFIRGLNSGDLKSKGVSLIAGIVGVYLVWGMKDLMPSGFPTVLLGFIAFTGLFFSSLTGKDRKIHNDGFFEERKRKSNRNGKRDASKDKVTADTLLGSHSNYNTYNKKDPRS